MAVITLTILVCVQTPTLAVSVNGSLTSTFWLRESRLEGAEDQRRSLILYEYLRFHATNLGSRDLSAYLSGRVGWDRIASYGDKYAGRLYQGYLDWKVSNRIGLRAGRQFLPSYSGFWQMDGIRLDFRPSRSVSPAFYAGTAVSPWSIADNSEVILGLELRTRKFWQIRSKFSFLTVLESDREDWAVLGVKGLDRAIAGIQLDTSDMGFLDLHNASRQRLSVSGGGSMDLLAKQIIDAHASISARVLPETQLYTEYRHRVPLFPIDSIFSVFGFESLHQLSVSLDHKIMRFLSLQGRYARQFFDSGPVSRYSGGIALSWKRETPFSFRLEHLNDIDTHYWRAHYNISKQIGPRFSISFSNYYNNYRLTRSIRNEEAYSFQLKGNYQLNRTSQVSIRLEDNINPDYEYNVRVFGYLRMGFGSTR